MQVTGQNVQQKTVPQPQYNSSYNCGYPVAAVQQTQAIVPSPAQIPQYNNTYVTNPNTAGTQALQAVPPQYNPQYCAPQYAQYPQQQYQAPAKQNYQVPASTSGVNIQIFNPSVTTPGSQPPTYNVNAPCYPSNYYTGQMGQNGNASGNVNNNANTNSSSVSDTKATTETVKKDDKKTEKKKIVQLTDEYIRNLENYLNSQDKQIRLSAAKEVYARLDEDESRKDDKALTALVNKMLQDPAQEIRLLGLTALEGRIVNGDDFTTGVLKNMQNSKDGYGQDAVDAARILLQMSGKQVEKEVPVKENTKTKTEKKESKESSKA